MTRSQISEYINALSDEELACVAPYLEADLDALGSLDRLRAEIRKGRQSSLKDGLCLLLGLDDQRSGAA